MLTLALVSARTMAASEGETFLQKAKEFWVDNEPFFGTNALRVGVGALYSHGKKEYVNGPKTDTWGGYINAGYNLDEKGQVNIGLLGAFFDGDFYTATFKTELGKTWTIPYVNEKVYTFVGGGPALRLDNPDNLLGTAYTGLVWKKDIVKATETSAPWTLYTSVFAAKVADWGAPVYGLGFGVSHKF